MRKMHEAGAEGGATFTAGKMNRRDRARAWLLGVLVSAVALTAFGTSPALAAPPTSSVGSLTPGEDLIEVAGTVVPNGEEAVVLAEYSNAEAGPFSAEFLAEIPNGTTVTTPVRGTITGLQPHTTYFVRLDVVTPGEGEVLSPAPYDTVTTPKVPPTEVGASVISVGADTASVAGTLDTQDEPTSYLIEYGPSTSYGSSTSPSPELPASPRRAAYESSLTGLAPATTYHWRLVATNGGGTARGPDHTFTTLELEPGPQTDCPNQALRLGQGASLPDCRAYEQATPVDKGGLDVEGFPDLLNAATDGSSVSFFSAAGSGIPAAGGGRQDTTTYLSSLREGSWSTQSLLPPESDGPRAAFLGASPDMHFALVEAGTQQESALFITDITVPQSLTQITPYQSEFGVGQGPLGAGTGAFAYDAITGDGTTVFFESQAGLAAGAVVGHTNLYVWERATGTISVAGLLPATEGGHAPSGGTFGGAYEWYSGSFETGHGGALVGNYVEAVNAASGDGNQVYFTAGESGQLYLRRGLDSADPQTLHISAPTPGAPMEAERPSVFLEASPEGGRGFFTSSQKLTENASTGPSDEGRDLYRFDPEAEELVDVTPDQNPEDPNGAEVLGLLGTSSNGTSGYFAARGELAPGGTVGLNNIYRFVEQVDGTFSFEFVATGTGGFCGAGEVGRNWSPSSFCSRSVTSYLGKTSRVTPDGQNLLFMKEDQTMHQSEVFLYDAGSGETFCVSCSQSGAKSPGPAELTTKVLNTDIGLTPSALPEARLTRNISADGTRIFFQTPDSLVAADKNGGSKCSYINQRSSEFPTCEDVYEWEAPGAPGGTCTAAEVNGGCLYLLSSGKSDEPSYFIDASVDGSSAFIATTSKLVNQDHDNIYDIYDVRSGGGLAAQQQFPKSPCTGETCLGSLSVPVAPVAAGTPTFQGPGNPVFKTCGGKGFVRRAGRCVKPRHKSTHRKRGRRHRSHNKTRRRAAEKPGRDEVAGDHK